MEQQSQHYNPISPEEMYRFLLLSVGTGAPGGMTWAMSPLADGEAWDRLDTVIELTTNLLPKTRR